MKNTGYCAYIRDGPRPAEVEKAIADIADIAELRRD
jgi:hypothetical protein